MPTPGRKLSRENGPVPTRLSKSSKPSGTTTACMSPRYIGKSAFGASRSMTSQSPSAFMSVMTFSHALMIESDFSPRWRFRV